MKVKDGVILPPVVRIYRAIEKVYGDRQVDPVITSGMDGKHMAGSKHYTGEALDTRIWNLGEDYKEKAIAVRAELQTELGVDFDVVLESTHIHIEYDPLESL